MGKIQRRLITVFGIILQILLFCGSVFAAPSSFRVRQAYLDFPALSIYADLLDSRGMPVLPREGSSMTASVSGSSFRIDSWRSFSAEREGLLTIFLVDISGSIGTGRFNELQQALAFWIRRMGPADKAAVIAFGEKVALKQGFTSEMNALLYAVDSLVAEDSYAQLNSGVLRALELARVKSSELPLRRMILLCSDGFREMPGGVTSDEVRTSLASDSVPIYSIFFDSSSRESNDRIEETQQLLNEIGFDSGLVDGRLGPRTVSAIRTFQRNRGIVVDGTVSNELLSVLRNMARNQKEYSLTIIGEYSRRSGGEVHRLGTAPFSAAFDSIATSLNTALVLNILLEGLPADGTVKRIDLTFFDGAVTLSDGIAVRMPSPASSAMQDQISSSERTVSPWLLFLLGVLVAGGVLLAIIREKRKKEESSVKRIFSTEPLADALFDEAPVSMISIELVASGGGSGVSLQAAFSDRLQFGRSPGPSALTILGDSSVSSRHCEFIFTKGKLFVKDLDSSNGTMVNGVFIQGNYPLEDGDRITVGKTEFRLRILAVFEAYGALLLGISGSYAEQRFQMPPDGLVFGREPAICNLVIQSSMISRRHARLSRDSSPRGWILEDLNSTNGTFVMNGDSWTRITGKYCFKLSYEAPGLDNSQGSKRFRLGDESNEFEIRQGRET